MSMLKVLGIIFLLTLSVAVYAQSDSPNWNSDYVTEIDSLMNSKELQAYFYPNKSFCGGALDGFYRDDQLVYIQSTFSGDSSFRSLNAYLNQGETVYVVYEEHFPDWDSEDQDKAEMIHSKRVIAKDNNEYVIIERLGKVQSRPDGDNFVNELIRCIESMKNELAEEKREVNER